MEPDRRDRISDLYHRALERAPGERVAFLRDAAGGDDLLRREVESLFVYESDSTRFLTTPALEMAAVAGMPGAAAMIGRQLGPYTVRTRIGAGGMGEVYRAHDSKLGRDVAIKILPPQFTADPERRSRFAREARVLATLNHPHIGAIYGFEETDGVSALVLELVEGPTLADRLGRGPLPIPQALTIARQIADALDAAHERGIVHRDLKPANIVLQGGVSGSGDVRVKVLDFGLAKLSAAATADAEPRPPDSVGDTADGRLLGSPSVHEPGAGPWRGRRQAHGHLGVRMPAVRDADRTECVRG